MAGGLGETQLQQLLRLTCAENERLLNENQTSKNETKALKCENEALQLEARTLENDGKLLKDENRALKAKVATLEEEKDMLRLGGHAQGNPRAMRRREQQVPQSKEQVLKVENGASTAESGSLKERQRQVGSAQPKTHAAQVQENSLPPLQDDVDPNDASGSSHPDRQLKRIIIKIDSDDDDLEVQQTKKIRYSTAETRNWKQSDGSRSNLSAMGKQSQAFNLSAIHQQNTDVDDSNADNATLAANHNNSATPGRARSASLLDTTVERSNIVATGTNAVEPEVDLAKVPADRNNQNELSISMLAFDEQGSSFLLDKAHEPAGLRSLVAQTLEPFPEYFVRAKSEKGFHTSWESVARRTTQCIRAACRTDRTRHALNDSSHTTCKGCFNACLPCMRSGTAPSSIYVVPLPAGARVGVKHDELAYYIYPEKSASVKVERDGGKMWKEDKKAPRQ
ncbi:hypothetical protein LTR10_007602 [Elasticomyces elasticus]|nr:hypothetical protein LTR10_007602 [Elasticomyces elasticus]KAK4970606.1 hypothetical protein LTR42_007581 [Elasticomyces elasticus]